MDLQQKYLASQIENATPLTLVVLLYEGAIRFLNNAKDAFEKKETEEFVINISKARNIISEFMCTLNADDGGDVAKNLLALYVFIYEQLVYANIYKEVNGVNSAIDLLSGLLESWRSIANQETASEAQAPAADPMTYNQDATAEFEAGRISFNG